MMAAHPEAGAGRSLRAQMARVIGRLAGVGSARRSDSARWVVLDLETSGLDPGRDALLAIGAVALSAHRIVVADSLETVVRPEQVSSRSNILVHGLGAQAQRDGADPGEACANLLAFIADAPLVAFQADFDRAFLTRFVRIHGAVELTNPWLDLAQLAPALHPRCPAQTLDEWLIRFEIEVEQRHHAVADALASAMLLQRLLADVPPGERAIAPLQALCRQARWLGA